MTNLKKYKDKNKSEQSQTQAELSKERMEKIEKLLTNHTDNILTQKSKIKNTDYKGSKLETKYKRVALLLLFSFFHN